MNRFRDAVVRVHRLLTCLLPGEFRHRYLDEIQLDFSDQLDACSTRAELTEAACGAYADLVTSAVREWRACDTLRTLVLAAIAHTTLWLTAVGVAALEWPGGSRLWPVALLFAIMSEAGLTIAVWRQRVDPRQRPVVRWTRPS